MQCKFERDLFFILMKFNIQNRFLLISVNGFLNVFILFNFKKILLTRRIKTENIKSELNKSN